MSATSMLRIEDWKVANQELDSRFVAAMSTKNIEGAMSCFIDSPDLVAVLWGKELRGPEQVRDAISSLFAAYDEVTLSIDRVREFRSGDSVLAVGQATYMLRRAAEVTRLTEIWTDVRHEVGGRWVYVMDHAEALPKSEPLPGDLK